MNKKRLIAAATSALCLASNMVALPQFAGMQSFATEAVRNDFEVTYEGWHGSDMDHDIKAIEGIGFNNSRGMLVSGRESTVNGAASSKGLYLWGGIKYDYSVMVKADTDEVFHMTLLYKDGDTDMAKIVEIASQEVKAGEWTELKATYEAPSNTYEYEIKINTDTTNDFVFDDVVITTKQGKAVMEANAAAEGLKDALEGYGFRVGNILNGGTIRNSTITASFLKDYNAVECENETKADAVLRQSGSTDTNINVSLDNCAAIADFAQKNGLGFRGHAFVWHSQTPAWFLKENFNGNGNWVSPSVMDVRLDSYIHNVFKLFEEKYPTLDLYAYDVCNECVSDDSNRTKNNGGAREPGDNNQQGGKSAYVAVYGDNSFVEKAFTIARKYAPKGCKLFYNDYNEYWDHKRDCIINTILKPLSAKGVLDGMGMQSHVDAGHTSFSGTVNYLNAMDMYLALGIDVQVTELDISLDSGQSLQDQATKYTNIVKHIVEVNTSGKYQGRVTLFQVWGPNDANTWISGDKSPTLYDKNNQPKAAYTSLMNYGNSLAHPGPIPDVGGGTIAEPEVDGDGYWFHHKFEGTDEGWSGRGSAKVQTSGRTAYAGSEALLISDREAEWNGGQYSLGRAFKAGEEYSFSANFRYEDGTAVKRDFKLTLEYTNGDGDTTWDQIAAASAGAGAWVQLANTNYKLPADGSGFKIIAETTDGTLDNFYIDEVIGAPAGTVIKGAGQPSLPKDPSVIIPGDTTCDGEVDAFDLVLARQALLGKTTDAAILKAADVDKSGELEINDLVLLSEFLLGKIKTFPDNSPPIPTPDLSAAFSGISINSSYKKDTENNPLYTQRFGADPGFMVYKDRLYVYTTNDAFEYNGSTIKENSYDVGTINCCSSADLVNWTDHGAIPVAGRNGRTQGGVASWASCSWAPDACWKTINGKDKFFLYFANSGGGIGVLTADSPTGPWKDPLGHALLTGGSPNCSDVVWMFDPGVMVDDDGTGYLYFGGGVDNRDKANPKTGRCVKLGDDMISLAGTPVTMETPYLFEDSSILKIGDTYYYSYCANWNVPGGANINGQSFGSADICYMTSKNPLGPWSSQNFGGAVFKNTGGQGLDNGGNNHHSIVYFKNKYYVLYHTRQLEMRMNGGKDRNYRSPSINECTLSNGKLTCKGTHEGVAQLETLNPYTTVQAETMSNQSKGIAVNGLMDTTVAGKKGEWIKVSGVQFKGTSSLTVKAKSNGGAIKLCVGSPTGDAIAYVQPEGTMSEQTVGTLMNVSGTKDIYFVFSGDVEFDSWSIA